MAETMDNGRSKQENQGENAGQNSGHKPIREDHRNSRWQNKEQSGSKGRRKGDKPTLVQVRSSLVSSKSVTLLFYLETRLIIVTPK